jgi:DNA topoisomerase-1
MSQAQRLYEGVELKDRGTTALITYMRTDSVRVANEARDAARAYIGKNLGKDYLPDKPRGYKSRKGAQEAHEAIRPVDVYLTPEDVKDSLPRDQFRLYQLIWQRFMASQMAPARFWDTVVTAECRGTLWRAKGERLLFPGFLKVYGRDEGEVPTQLPKLQEGQTLTLEKLSKEQKFTQPPPRYSEASLVKELEDKGIGRPSTYASIISTLLDRDYARLEEKRFVPTELGTTVSDMLTRHFESLMDIGFTANMEESLDKVAEGEQDWVNLLKSFTGEFYPTLETARQNMKQVKGGMETDVACEKCGKPMVIRFGKMGEFLGCSGYPECRNIKDFERDDKGEIRIVERQVLEPVKVGECPDCGSDLVIKKARSGNRFIACTGYPKCKHAGPYSTEVACPREKCPGELIERASKRGKIFYSCSEYPKCDYATWDWPVKQECPECGHPILVRKSTKSRGEHLACPRKGCRYMESLPEPEEAQD